MTTDRDPRRSPRRAALLALVVLVVSSVGAQLTSWATAPRATPTPQASDAPRDAVLSVQPVGDPGSGTDVGPGLGQPDGLQAPPEGGEGDDSYAWEYYEFGDEFEPSDEMRSMRAWCQETGVENRSQCPVVYFSDYTLTHGVEEAMAEIERWKVLDRNFLPECHHAYHGVGQTAPGLLGYEQALAVGTASCQAGYPHGVMQIWTTKTPKSEILAEAADLCLSLEDAGKSDLVSFCGHGVGHAIGLYWPEDLYVAAQMCMDEMPHPGLQTSCFDGIVMEFSGHDPATAEMREIIGSYPPGSVTDTQRVELCSNVDELLLKGCWLKIYQFWTDLQKAKDSATFSERCATAPRQEWERLCIQSLGQVVMYWSWPVSVMVSEEKLHKALEPCSTLPDHQVGWCVEGFVELMWRDEPIEGAPVDTVCDRVPDEMVDSCLIAEKYSVDVVRPSA